MDMDLAAGTSILLLAAGNIPQYIGNPRNVPRTTPDYDATVIISAPFPSTVYPPFPPFRARVCACVWTLPDAKVGRLEQRDLGGGYTLHE